MDDFDKTFMSLFPTYDDEKETIDAKIYSGGKGSYSIVPITNVLPEDAAYIKENNLLISMEDVGFSIAVYICDKSDTSEESELTEFAFDNPCETVIHTLVEKYKKRKVLQ